MIRTRLAAVLTAATVLSIGSAATATAATSAGSPCRGHAAVQRALDRLTGPIGLPGASVQIEDPTCGSWFGRSGVADRRTGRAMQRADRIRIGSTTKTFTATVVLQLVAEGRIGLDAPLEKYLPGLVRRNGYDGRKITVRQLLQHTSGLADHTDSPVFADFRNWRYRHFTPRQLVEIALDLPHPEKKWNYSTTNYILAGMIVHKVTGHSLEREVTRRIIEPLGLHDTYWPGDSTTIRGRHPRGYDPESGADLTSLNASFGGAGGALISTPGDLNRFFGALLGGRLLPASLLTQMRHTVPADPDRVWPGARYGLGLITTPLRCGGSWTGHAGSVPGFRAAGGESTEGRRIAIPINAVPPTLKAENAFRDLIQTALCS